MTDLNGPGDPVTVNEHSASVLERTARAYNTGQIDRDTAASVAHAWADPSLGERFWPLFEEYASLLELRDTVPGLFDAALAALISRPA